MPGETGYRVVGPDGKPLGGGAEITAQNKTEAPAPVAWWSKLWGSVEAADKPAPPKPKAKEPKPITPDTKPNNATATADADADRDPPLRRPGEEIVDRPSGRQARARPAHGDRQRSGRESAPHRRRQG